MTKSELIIISNRPSETLGQGRRVGQAARPGDVIALVGPLGAGKTVFVKGLAEGAGVPDVTVVNSPTFVIVNEYDAPCRVFHLDAYRLAGSQELWAIGFEEMCENGVVVVEWADKVLDIFPIDHLRIDILPVGDTQRQLTFRNTGPRSARLVRAVRS